MPFTGEAFLQARKTGLEPLSLALHEQTSPKPMGSQTVRPDLGFVAKFGAVLQSASKGCDALGSLGKDVCAMAQQGCSALFLFTAHLFYRPISRNHQTPNLHSACSAFLSGGPGYCKEPKKNTACCLERRRGEKNSARLELFLP